MIGSKNRNNAVPVTVLSPGQAVGLFLFYPLRFLTCLAGLLIQPSDQSTAERPCACR